ncbi:MAG TPA: site-specific integrase [Terriglobales bacterium]|jgi:integrase|nr:site-specific integrase [Terriglobales bacterium]
MSTTTEMTGAGIAKPAAPERPPARRARGAGRIFRREGTNSLWIQYSRDGHRYRESAHTLDEKQAERLLQKRLGEITNEEFLPPKSRRVKISELADDFLLECKNQKQTSVDDAEARWKLHLKPFFGHRRAKDTTTELLRRYIAKRQGEGAKNATINRELAALKRMFNLAKQATPPKVLRVPTFPSKLAEDNVRRGFVDDAQYDKLAAACAKRGLWLRTLFEVAYNFGCRLGELLSLKVSQVDLAAKSITLVDTKNGEDRTFTLTAKAYALVQQCVTGKEPNDHVFTWPNGKPIKDFRDSWATVCKQAGVPGLLFHDLRRTGARNMVRSGVPERVVMAIGGWKTRSVFDRYNIVSERDLQDAARKLENRLIVLPQQPQPEAPTQQQASTDQNLPN